MDLCERMARIVLSQSSDHRKVNDDDLDDERMPIGRDQDAWGFRKTSMISITGRVVLNVWRLMRSELDLTSYTLETMVWHVLHQRVPKFSHRTLTSWYCSSPRSRIHTLRYYSDRARLSLELLDECNVIGRTRLAEMFEMCMRFALNPTVFYTVNLHVSMVCSSMPLSHVARSTKWNR